MSHPDARTAAEALYPPRMRESRKPSAGTPGEMPASATAWTRAVTAADLLAAGSAEVEWLDPPFLARGAITEISAPRGTGKSVALLLRLLALARTGLRICWLDRDNSPATLRKRLRGIGADR